jgi:hypothetical protein
VDLDRLKATLLLVQVFHNHRLNVGPENPDDQAIASLMHPQNRKGISMMRTEQTSEVALVNDWVIHKLVGGFGLKNRLANR